MEILTWNANMGYRTKQRVLLNNYSPDIAAIQECEDPKEYPKLIKEWDDYIWTGNNKSKGLALFIRNGKLRRTNNNFRNEYFVTAEHDGNLLVACWTQNNNEVSQERYIGQLYSFLSENEGLIKQGRTFILGDLNWSSSINASSPLIGTFSETIELIRQHGSLSAYHEYNETELGQENQSTLYMRKKRSDGYHTDYIFTPQKYSVEHVEVGQYDFWSSYSDHMPLCARVLL